MLTLTCEWLRSAGPPPWDSAALGKRRAQEVRLEVVTAGEMEEREVEEAEQIAEGRGATEFEELLRYVQTHHITCCSLWRDTCTHICSCVSRASR